MIDLIIEIKIRIENGKIKLLLLITFNRIYFH